MNSPTPTLSDAWSDWLLHDRHGGDPALGRFVSSAVDRYADRVLDGAQLGQGMTLADIGTGEGLIAFRAIDRIGASLRVIATDISPAMLHHVENMALQRGVSGQCTFVQCAAENLKGIDDASVDVVTLRAVLAYVADKGAALHEIKRILKPGGRLSFAEPILRDDAIMAVTLKQLLDASPAETDSLLIELLHRWKSAQFPDTPENIATNPLTSHSERDLIKLVHNVGFADIHMELHIDISPSTIPSWDVFTGISPHPLAPSLAKIMATEFTDQERQFFEQTLRPSIESNQAVVTERVAYLIARKPLLSEAKESTELFYEIMNAVKG